MANALYDKGRQKFLEGAINWLSDNIKLILVDAADYTVNLTTHEFLASVPLIARVATSDNLTGKTSTNGIADADDVTLTAVTGDVSEALVIFKDTGVEATSSLIAYIDTASGFPFTPAGSDILIQFDNGSNKIFKL